MDALAEFLPFLLFLVYAVLRAIRGRKAAPEQEAQRTEGDLEGRSDGRTDLDELARHLEALMTGTPVDAPPPPRPEPRYEPEFQNAEAPVNESASFQHERHGFGAENPFSEESFENRPAFSRSRKPAKAAAPFDPHGLKRSRDTGTAPSTKGSSWRTRLADPKRAREAFVLQTILERPQDRKR